MRCKAIYHWILVLVILALSSLLFITPHPGVRAQSVAPCCSQNVGPREMVFPYYSITDGFDSTLLLVSDSPKPLNFILAIHNLSGQTQLSPSICGPCLPSSAPAFREHFPRAACLFILKERLCRWPGR